MPCRDPHALYPALPRCLILLPLRALGTRSCTNCYVTGIVFCSLVPCCSARCCYWGCLYVDYLGGGGDAIVCHAITVLHPLVVVR